jgi:hypothetical protein
MPEIAKRHSERLNELKKNADEGRKYFSQNAKRFNEYKKFVFKSSMDDNDAATAQEMGRPTIEFNILEAIISRLKGEFAKQQPSLSVRASDGVPLTMLNEDFIETIKVVEAHLRSIFFDGSTDMFGYTIYDDMLGGGYSVGRIYTKYINEMSFEQNICIEKAYNANLCFFDPLAKESHKGDGRFCGEIYPMTKEDFLHNFGQDALDDMTFTRSLSGFDWSFKSDDQEIVLVCDYYEKKCIEEKILKLSNGHTVTQKKYDKFLEEWNQSGALEQPPIPIKSRRTTIEKIVRYRFCESRVLDYIETNYKYLPLVFFDGNSVVIEESGAYNQMTKPYAYHARGIQMLKNFAGQSLANELENTMQQKIIVALESIPSDYLNAYTNMQKADTIVYNHFLQTKNGPNLDVPLPAPREVVRTPIPPQISDTFRMADEMTQTILGNYDSSAGINSAQLSGLAFARSAIQTNTASMPYTVGYIRGLNRCAEIIVDLIPKYYITPRSLPILLPNGKRDYMEINKKGSVYMNFDSNSLQVKVEAGVNFSMQKEIALQTVMGLSQSSKVFGDFFGDEGLPTILDNLEMRGIDELKEKAATWQQRREQQQQMAMQQQQAQSQQQQQQIAMSMADAQKKLQSPTKEQIDLLSLQEKSKYDSASISIKEREAETKFLEVMSKIQNQDVESELKAAEIDAENTRSAVESMVNISSHIGKNLNEDVLNV